MVDLVPFVWLLSAKSRVKHAAAIAGVIGVARVALPQLTLGFIAARYGGQGPFGPSAGDYPSRDPSCFVDPIMLVPLVLLMLGIFAVSAIFCVFLIRRAGSQTNGTRSTTPGRSARRKCPTSHQGKSLPHSGKYDMTIPVIGNVTNGDKTTRRRGQRGLFSLVTALSRR